MFPDPFVASGKIPPFRRHLDRWRRALLVAPWRGFSPKNGWRLQMWECPACFILFDCRAITFITGLILGMVMDISSVKHMKHLLLTWGRLRVCPTNFNPKCSRIELKMTETEQSNCIDQSAPFVMQLALRLCFCQMPIASITNGFTETLNCSGGVTRQNPPNPPEREARASTEGKKRVVGGKTPLYTIKSAATTWLPKHLRWHDNRSYDVLNFLKRWGHSSGHPEEPREI